MSRFQLTVHVCWGLVVVCRDIQGSKNRELLPKKSVVLVAHILDLRSADLDRFCKLAHAYLESDNNELVGATGFMKIKNFLSHSLQLTRRLLIAMHCSSSKLFRHQVKETVLAGITEGKGQ